DAAFRQRCGQTVAKRYGRATEAGDSRPRQPWGENTIMESPLSAQPLPRAAVIAATGLHTPPHSISNAELVSAFNAWVERFNAENTAAIAAGELEPQQPSSAEFIEKASGVKARRVMNKTGVLDPARMRPAIPARSDESL